MNMTVSASEHMLSELVSALFELVPSIDVEKAKGKLSSVITKYHITKVDGEEAHPDLQEKIELFIASKKLEGLSSRTLDNYRLDLNLFADAVKKKAQDITAADIRVYLGKQEHLK